MTLSLYLAHNFKAREVLKYVVEELETKHGFHVTSRWITDDSHVDSKNREQNAVSDVEDIEAADVVVLFVDQYGERPGRGKWWEFGFAVGLGIPVFLVGEDTNCIFYHLPTEEYRLYRHRDLESAVQGLKELRDRIEQG